MNRLAALLLILSCSCAELPLPKAEMALDAALQEAKHICEVDPVPACKALLDALKAAGE